MVAPSSFYMVVSVFSSVSTILAVQVHPIKRNVVSTATCVSGYSWMDDSQGNSPCLTVAYVEAPCFGNSYTQPILNNGYLYTLPNSTNANPCYCSWSSYNLMMACTICQGSNDSAVWGWAEWASGCGTNTSWTEEYYPSGYVLSANASIPYWATTNPTIWSSGMFNIMDATGIYQKDNSSITPGVSSSPSGSSSSSSSKSTNVGAIVGGTIGALAALSLFAVGAYLVYRRHVYKQGAYASVINQQPFIDRGDGAATRMTHDSVPPDSSNFSQSFVSPVLYGQSPPTSQYGTVYSPQPQMAFSSLQGSLSPPPRPVTSLHTTHIMQPSDAIPML
jgi:hypothetical protein